MKLLKFIPVLAGMLILGNFASCKKDEPADPAHFGKWKRSVETIKMYTSNVLVYDTTYNSDDSFSEILNFKDGKNLEITYSDGFSTEVFQVTYKIEGTVLTVTYDDSSSESRDYFKVDGSKLYVEFYLPSKTSPDRDEYYTTYNKMN